ncbi:putative DNA-binding transcriptional regulator YafY [Rhodoblastus acidophilus]|uniref:helix-turn-helix transcriptional regulator n=1 Tax=Rhodoblastus acidophilus TaxID=1074 RepID=UPI0022247C70|nr:YafY family protein [Rhodoblastus acidophilus]MCW2283146.1 putative DNA-binding transcriptional regulator YafY [Rhodoblastus acidophilus]MCW2331803.1 putative DNA-binding transcriptional regulator YafY [Rhodoblastus acidophilus]
MSRSARLLHLLQILRGHRQPVSGRTLADETGVSLRTLYRDIQALCAQGAPIEGEAGLGFILRPGFLLPPLMLDDSEAEALTLGLRWVAAQGDPALARAARAALAKISAVLPERLADLTDDSGLLAPPTHHRDDLSEFRRAIKEERVALIAYVDAEGVASERRIWPIALAFFDHRRVLAAWCEMRGDFRHFRLDRLRGWRTLEDHYPRRRRVLMREWRAREGISPAMGPMLLTETDAGLR